MSLSEEEIGAKRGEGKPGSMNGSEEGGEILDAQVRGGLTEKVI